MPKCFSYYRFSHPDQREGDSLRRQTAAAEQYAKEKGWVIDTSLKPDLAVSAFRGKHRKTGNLAAFLRKIENKEVPAGSILLLESLDRLSREELEESFDLLRSIVRAGVEVHTISDRQIYKKGHMDAQQMIMSIFVLARSNEESKRKSERLTAVAEQQRQRARNGEVITARAPGWLEARKGEKIKVIRHHAKTLKEIFSLALKGYGAVRICDYLIFKNRPCWTYTRWSPHYVSQLLRSRLPLGEMQPGRCPRGCKRVVEGEPIKDYYPRIIDEETWNRVQLIRSRSFGRGKVEVGKIKGRGGRSNWKNLFLGLLRDQDGNTVIYKQIQDNWAYLISNDRAKFKTHKVRYLPFQRAILKLLNDIDYASLINPDHQKELDAIEVSLEKIERKLARFNSYLQGDEEPPELLIQNIRKAEKEQKELLAEKEEILALDGAQEALQGGIPVIEYRESSRESNVRLREEIRKRINRIDLTFGAEILTPDNQTIANVAPGQKQVMAKITFASGATRWAVINNDQAVLLS